MFYLFAQTGLNKWQNEINYLTSALCTSTPTTPTLYVECVEDTNVVRDRL